MERIFYFCRESVHVLPSESAAIILSVCLLFLVGGFI